MKAKNFERALNNEVSVVSTPLTQKNLKPTRYTHKKPTGAVALVSYGGLRQFHNPATKLAEAFKQALEDAARIQPVKNIDPSTVEVKPLKKYEDMRFRAARLAKKYFNWPPMRKYALIARRHRLTPYQCGIIFNLAKKIQEKIARGEKPKNEDSDTA